MAPTNLPEDEGSRMRRLERELKAVRDRVGLVAAKFRGEFEVLHATAGTWLLKLGKGGNGKYFFSLRRDNGTAAIELGTHSNGNQFWAGWDNAGNIVSAEDAASGQGLSRPWLPHGTVNVLSTAIPTHGTGSYIATQSTGSVQKQQPYVELEALVLSTGGGVGDARFTINGTAVGTVMPITAGSFGWQAIQTVALPGNFSDRVKIEVETQRTNGVGAVGAVFRCSQRQSP